MVAVITFDYFDSGGLLFYLTQPSTILDKSK